MKKIIFVLVAGFVAVQAMAGAGNEMLDLYAHLTNKTVLYPGNLPRMLAAVAPQLPADTNNVAAFIEGQLKNLRMEIVPDGAKFVRILPAGWQNSPLGTQLGRLQPPPVSDAKAENGVIDLQSVDLVQVLEIYSQICNRTVLRPSALPATGIYFKNQTALTREETIYALNVIFGLNGIATFADGDKFVQVVPLERAAQVRTRAPKPEAGAPLIDPEQVRKAIEDPDTAAKTLASLPPGAGPRRDRYSAPTTAIRLTAYYAELTGQKVTPPKNNFQDLVYFKTLTPLTKPELLYAIETTLQLNNHKIVPAENNSITVEPF